MRIRINGLEHLRGGVIVGITNDSPEAGILEVRILEEMKHPPTVNDAIRAQEQIASFTSILSESR